MIPMRLLRCALTRLATLGRRTIGSSGHHGGGAMNENFPQFRAGRQAFTGRPSLTHAEISELQRLFDHAADTCDAAALALGDDDEGLVLTVTELQRLRDLYARIGSMIDRIGATLG